MYKTKRSNRNLRSPKALLLAVGAVVLISGTAFALQRQLRDEPPSEQTQTTNDSNGINLDPATPEDKAESERHKDEIDRQEEERNNPSTGKKKVEPNITSAGTYEDNVEVRVGVPGVLEATGTCTATFTKSGEQAITREVEGIAGPSETFCDTIAIPVSEFPSKGMWQVVVSYESPKAEGVSASEPVEVK